MRSPHFLIAPLVLCVFLAPAELRSQGVSRAPVSLSDANLASSYVSPDLEVHVTAADNKSVDGQVVVQLIDISGHLYAQASLKNGQARFNKVPKSEFRVLVTAAGYQRGESKVDLTGRTNLAKVDVQLLPVSDAQEAASARVISSLNPKAQKEVGKALESLRVNKPNNALSHLEAAQKTSPDSAEVEYLFGIYSSQLNDDAQAEAHWTKALSIDAKHLGALLEMGQELLHEKKPAAEAISYLNRAVEAEPSSWRAHALLAEADYLQNNSDDAIKQAERALELGHDRASSVQPFLARILAERGDKDRATQILQDYLKAHPSDAAAAKQAEDWKNPAGPSGNGSSTKSELSAVSASATELPVPSNWLPPDVDERIPPVEPGVVCPTIKDVLQKTGEQLVTLVQDVERFSATESVIDQTINKWGAASSPETRKFSYVVSIQEIRPGMLSVDEYRGSGAKPPEFPDGVITNGLPALVMIFHPFYAGNYDMTCEGLARWNGGLAWQVHFRQRQDKPIANRGFRVGMSGALYPVALRGRAWISADNSQIVRLETDLVSPVPQIRLVAEHAAIEYGAVDFHGENLKLWLPQSAEVYFDWRGRRVHRRHGFDNYLLFSVDEKQRIGKPKEKPPTVQDNGAAAAANQP
jgi:tetratricopeptide (TPR) repeat protein